MKIYYVAKHGSGGADDEGAIAYSFRHLGHEVIEVKEDQYDESNVSEANKCDMLLFHHSSRVTYFRPVKVPKVFWYFDLVDYSSDQTLNRRNQYRKWWMDKATSVVDLGFCTDGDWAVRGTGKLEVLRQGIDPRMLTAPTDPKVEKKIPILFTGISTHGGSEREQFVQYMMDEFGDKFFHYRKGIYREQLATKIGESKIVVAPWSPITRRYWSNRVYNAIGMGGFVLHPYCDDLAMDLQNGTHLAYYRNRNELKEVIEELLREEYVRYRYRVACEGYKEVTLKHTYVNRVQEMLTKLKKRNILDC